MTSISQAAGPHLLFPPPCPLPAALWAAAACNLQVKRLNDTSIIRIATHLREPLAHSYALPES